MATSRQKAKAQSEREAKDALLNSVKENDGREWSAKHIDSVVLRKAFQLHIPPCGSIQGKNCGANPRCLHGLGQHKEGIWLDNPPQYALVPSCMDAMKIDPTSYAGLRNLGATCYMNSLLQCLFMNLPFRRAIYEYRGPPDPIILQMQELFVALQCTKRAHIDPTQLVDALQIPQTHQQDVQEFNNLLLNRVGSLLKSSQNVDVVSDLFNGELGYTTICENCNQNSVRKSSFTDLGLQIRGKDSILDCLRDHFGTEHFEGNNQYLCVNCKSKQNALRETYLEVNPAVLQLHLMRFEYDVQSQSKVKLSDNILIPAQLDLNQIQSAQKQDSVYHLTAILRHRGSSAHCGHYIADVLDQATGVWWRFNDINVIKTGSLGGDDDDKTDSKPKKGQKRKQTPENSKEVLVEGQRSQNAYMVVYTRGPLAHVAVDVPAALNEMKLRVDSKDEQVASRVNELSAIKTAIDNLINNRKEAVRDMLSLAPVPEQDTSGRLVSTEWLKRWLTGANENGHGFTSNGLSGVADLEKVLYPGSVVQAAQRDIMCSHDGVDPNAVSKFKVISEDAWKVILENLNEVDAESLGEEKLCEECARTLMQGKLEVKQQAERQKALYEDLVNAPENIDEGFLVCSQWHRAWATQQKAPQVIELYAPTTPKTKGPKVPLWENINQHILCPHNKRAPDISKFKVVSEATWAQLLRAHPQSTAVKTSDEECVECVVVQAADREEKGAADDVRKVLRKGAPRAARDLPNSFPCVGKPPAAGKYNLVTAQWQHNFKDYVDGGGVPPQPLEVRCLRCTHNLLLYEPVPTQTSPRGTEPGVLYLMDPKNYAFLVEKFGVDGDPIVLTMAKAMLPTFDHLKADEVKLCVSCIDDRLASETQSRLSYDKGELKIVLLKPGSDGLAVMRGLAQGTRKTRSGRGEPHHLKISSTVTVHTLKMRILQEVIEDFSDFSMYLDDAVPLKKMDLSLSDAGIKNGCTIYVQPESGQLDLGIAVAPAREVGFLGTALLEPRFHVVSDVQVVEPKTVDAAELDQIMEQKPVEPGPISVD